VVDRPGEHPGELRTSDALFEGGHLRLGLGDDRGVVLAGAQVEQDGGVVDVARQFLDRREALLEARALARDGLRLLLVVPETGRERLLLEPVDIGLQLREVKDAPLAS
jgi:hypothetical protein